MCHALPVADADHALHHEMNEVTPAFAGWDDFKMSLAACAKCFGTFHRLDRIREVAIPKQFRKTFYAPFKEICPETLVTAKILPARKIYTWVLGPQALKPQTLKPLNPEA